MTTQTTPKDYTRTFAEVYVTELDYVKKRREKMHLTSESVERESERVEQDINKLSEKHATENPTSDKVPSHDVKIKTSAGLVGLAFSGGGIRSATFNLGILQALDKKGILRYCDYLSTVSGGGYIGSCLTSLLSNPKASTDSAAQKGYFPFRFLRDSESDDPDEVEYDLAEAPNTYDERKEMSHLRAAKNYLQLDRGLFSIETWRFIAMFLSGVLLINLIPLAIAISAAYTLFFVETQSIAAFIQTAQLNEIGEHIYKFDKATTLPNFYALTFFLFHIASAAFLSMVVVRGFAVLLNLNSSFIHNLQAWLIATTITLIVFIGLIALTFYLFLDEYQKVDKQIFTVLNYTLLATLFVFILGRLKTANKGLQKFSKTLLFLALAALLPILFAQFMRLLWTTGFLESALSDFISVSIFQTYKYLDIPMPIVTVFILVAIALLINLNRISFHAFYRNSLSRSYLFKQEEKQIKSNVSVKMSELHEHYNGPYHIINATLNIMASRNRYLRGRGADYFIFSKYYCGAESTGYRSTTSYNQGSTELATAMAISGAAASPKMGRRTNRLFALYMILFNIRLNVWMPNPDPKYEMPPVWPYYLLKEFFLGGQEDNSLLNLSDGGHHENLGIYPLLKRRCRLIIISDAAADPKFKMDDLANLQRKARIDLGINIKLNMTPLRPNKKGNVEQYYVKGTIHYPNDKNGTLLYIKTALTGNESEDLLAYRRQNPSFPDETTADQFFNEAQFESYRKLGEIEGQAVCPEIKEEIT
ncbi:MAG: patatin-like phospholipase family protein, partial [Candidatus Parabeggiatoa sp.]|nr:patatin-like phospholipase family protein [Candidatus Parabeggiatoa sp.]